LLCNLVAEGKQPVVEKRDVVVALLSGDAAAKYLFIREKRIELSPENPKCRPIPTGSRKNLRIHVEVVGTRRLNSGRREVGNAPREGNERRA